MRLQSGGASLALIQGQPRYASLDGWRLANVPASASYATMGRAPWVAPRTGQFTSFGGRIEGGNAAGDVLTLGLRRNGNNALIQTLAIAVGASFGRLDFEDQAFTFVEGEFFDIVVLTSGGWTATTLTIDAFAEIAIDAPLDSSSTVVAAPLFWSVNFEDATFGGLADVSVNAPTVDVINDPTTRASGKVYRAQVASTDDATTGLPSQLASLEGTVSVAPAYGSSFWLGMDRFFKSSNAATYDHRHVRAVLSVRPNSSTGTPFQIQRGKSTIAGLLGAGLYFSLQQDEAGVQVLNLQPQYMGFDLPDDEWHRLEIEVGISSAKNVADGFVRVYLDGARTATPTFQIKNIVVQFCEDADHITPQAPSFDYDSDCTVPLGVASYTDTQYMDNLTASTKRIGTAVFNAASATGGGAIPPGRHFDPAHFSTLHFNPANFT